MASSEVTRSVYTVDPNERQSHMALFQDTFHKHTLKLSVAPTVVVEPYTDPPWSHTEGPQSMCDG